MALEKELKELNRLFALFNKNFFDDNLQRPIIIIQSNGTKKQLLSWCTRKKIWQDKTNQQYYEITVCAEYLYRNPIEIAETLLHEMIHLYCLQNNIKDTSRNGSYHNKNFRNVAISKGLDVKYSKEYGWNETSFTDETRSFIKSKINYNNFSLTRHPILTTLQTDNENVVAESVPKSHTKRYVCPNCYTIVRAYKIVNIICGDCNVPFELSYKKVTKKRE